MEHLDQPKIWKIIFTIVLLIGVDIGMLNLPLFLLMMIVNLIVDFSISGDIEIK